MTVEEALRAAADRLVASGSPSPRLDAELLLGHVLGVDRTAILAHPEGQLSDDQGARFDDAVERRAAGEPVAYIRGFKEFYGLAFSVDPRALIPRPETERLVELAAAEVMRRLTSAPRAPGDRPILIADVGTGSGAVAVALAVVLRRNRVRDEFRVMATDIAPEALDVARENAVGHAVADRLRFVEADLLPPYIESPFDLILGNLPYVRSEVVPTLPVAASFEPRLALDGGPDGLSVLRALLQRIAGGGVVAADGEVLVEIGADQQAGITRAVAEMPDGWTCRVERDLAGLPRVARITPPAVTGEHH